jgi:cellulose synthase/poly-beta-1,6-N-acetylglucosamine synthase-like glycosyltransferase
MTFALVACLTIYGLRMLFFLTGFVRERRFRDDTPEWPSVSVIIPARNEELTLERCLTALQALDYPAERLQIIIVNDRSTDATRTVLDRAALTFPGLKVVHRVDTTSHPNLRGKPGALQEGIDHATGDILLFTDADCAVPHGWIRSMAAPFRSRSVGMVCSFTAVEGRSFFDVLQDVEWMYTQAMARAGVNHDIPLGCFGNNLAIRRSVYESLGGYEQITFSVTEDLALLQAVVDAGHEVIYRCREQSAVVTLPCSTFSEYVRQKQRWVRGGVALGWRATIFIVSSIALWSGMLLAIFTSSWMWLLAFILMRVLGDHALIAESLRRVGRAFRIPWIVPVVVMLFGMEIFLPLLTFRKNVVWKNQVFRQ